MSVDKYIKLEPYLLIKAPKVSKAVKVPIACHSNSYDPFCPKCGKVRKYKVEVRQEDAVDAYSVGKAVRNLYSPSDLVGSDAENHIWISNVRLKGVADSPNTNDNAIIPLSGELIEGAKRVWAHAFAADIAKIESAYGSKAEVCYGLLVWLS